MAELTVQVQASPNEVRRLLGIADTLPLSEMLSEAQERWLAAKVAALLDRVFETPPGSCSSARRLRHRR